MDKTNKQPVEITDSHAEALLHGRSVAKNEEPALTDERSLEPSDGLSPVEQPEEGIGETTMNPEPAAEMAAGDGEAVADTPAAEEQPQAHVSDDGDGAEAAGQEVPSDESPEEMAADGTTLDSPPEEAAVKAVPEDGEAEAVPDDTVSEAAAPEAASGEAEPKDTLTDAVLGDGVSEDTATETAPAEEVSEDAATETAPADEVTEDAAAETAPVEEVTEEAATETVLTEEAMEDTAAEMAPEEVSEEPSTDAASNETAPQDAAADTTPDAEVSEAVASEETPAEAVSQAAASEETPDEEATESPAESDEGSREAAGATIDLDHPGLEDGPEGETADKKQGKWHGPARKKKAGGIGKPFKIAMGVVGVLLAVYLGGAAFYHSHFFYNTKMNGYDASNKTVEQVKTGVEDNASTYTLTLKERNNQSETITAQQISLKYANDNTIQDSLNKQNPFKWPLALIGKTGDEESPSAYTYDKNTLKTLISQLNAVAGTSVVNAENAHPAYENGSIVIKNQVTGNQLNQNSLEKAVNKAIATGEKTLDLDQAGCYVAPTYGADSKEVASAKTVMDKYLSSVITYTFGDQKEVLDKNTFGPWLTVDDSMNVVVDRDQAAAYIKALADKYDTAWGAHSFTTSTGQAITVSGGNYGWEIDESSELDQLIPLIQAGTSTTREPAYVQTAKTRTGTNGDIGNTYVEVSISGQYMWFYKNGALVVGTPVVTGDATLGRGTPAGVYSLYGKQRNATLVGENYRTPVSYWMPFNGGVGIHDSWWRAGSEYGGSTYLGNGSHGCVNTPTDAVATIYNGIEVGDPIVVY